MTRILIIEARFYGDIADELRAGAEEALSLAGVTFDTVSVPGVLEIPAALAFAIDGRTPYDGYVLLGCVIRGETSHYDIVANESARAVMRLGVERKLALGNGVLTVETGEQAWARANRSGRNKGAGAAEAAMAMVMLRRELERT